MVVVDITGDLIASIYDAYYETPKQHDFSVIVSALTNKEMHIIAQRLQRLSTALREVIDQRKEEQ